MPTICHFDHTNTVRFITFSTFNRRPLLKQQHACTLLADEIAKAQSTYHILLFAYVFMPEHVHLLILPPVGCPVGKVLGEVKANHSRKFFELSKPGHGTSFWLKRCYDHNCRSRESVEAKVRYIHFNPVVRGLVREPGQWYWSSYRAYAGTGGGPIPVDPIPA